MKKIFFAIVLICSFLATRAQHILPVEISTDPRNIEIAIFGAGTVDGSSAAFVESFSSKADIGFVLNTMVRPKGSGLTYKQFVVNLNPIIIDWNSFSINTLTKTSIDSFSVQRMPFSEDCFLHIGIRSNTISRLKKVSDPNQRIMHSFWTDITWRPYAFDGSDSINLGKTLSFQTFNITAGYQYNFYKTEVPVIETFMIGLSPQICFMGVNEAEANQGDLSEVYGQGKYAGQNFGGFGGKLTVQIKHLNIFIEGRQYFGIDEGFKGVKFSSEAQMLVGAFGNLKFYTKPPKDTEDKKKEDWD